MQRAECLQIRRYAGRVYGCCFGFRCLGNVDNPARLNSRPAFTSTCLMVGALTNPDRSVADRVG
jgi:hypothetical protein